MAATRSSVTKSEIDAIVSRPYEVEFEYGDDLSEGVLARITEWPDCFAAGATRAEAASELDKALRAMVAFYLEESRPIPEPGAAFGGKVLLRLPKTVHREADRRAKSEGVSLNQWLGSTIARELGPRQALIGTERREFSAARRGRKTRKSS